MLLTTAAIAAATLGLVGCSSDEAPQSKSATSAETDSAAETPAELPAAGIREVPEACAELELALGAQLEGVALGECVSQALSSYGTGKMEISGETTGEVEFSYDPDFSVQGELQSPTGPVKLAYVDGEMWIDSGSGPVKGDAESAVLEEQLAAVAGELTRMYADIEQTVQLIQAQPVWRVAEDFETVELRDGELVEAYKIVSGGAFSWHEIPVSELTVWYGEDWVPLSTKATVEMMGMRSTNGQRFYDLGEPVTIVPLG